MRTAASVQNFVVRGAPIFVLHRFEWRLKGTMLCVIAKSVILILFNCIFWDEWRLLDAWKKWTKHQQQPEIAS